MWTPGLIAILKQSFGSFRHVPRADRRHAVEALALLFVLGLTEGAGLLLIVPLLELIGLKLADDGAIGRVTEWTAAAFSWAGLRPSLGGVLAIYVAVIATSALLWRRQAVALGRLREAVSGTLRRRVYDAVSHVEWVAFTRLRTTEVVHAIMIEAARIGDVTAGLLQLGSQVVLTLVYVIAAAALSPVLVVVAMVGAGALLLLVRSRRTAAYLRGVAVADASRALTAATSDLLGGAKTIRAHGLEVQGREMVDAHVAAAARERIGVDASHADARAWLEVGAAMVMAAIVSVSVAMEVPAATLLVLLFLFARIARRASSLHYQWQSLLADKGAEQAISALLLRLERDTVPQATGAGAGPFVLDDAIRLEEVSYRYPERDRWALERVSVEIPAGKVTVVTGPSGAGKTTLADLVLGMLTPNEGRIVIDSRPLKREDTAAWHRQLSYVQQEAFLLPGSVRENLAWAKPGATNADLERALRLADAWDFVQLLPRGIDTPVGERGGQLSGGQRQRLALACALIRRPQLLVLDEPTNALDVDAEARVWATIERLRGALTVLVISHRPESVPFADQHVAIEAGAAVLDHV